MQKYQHFEFKIKNVIIFDPRMWPDKRKAEEFEIQDSKLLYYFPQNADQNEKRNHVGLQEGSLMYWDDLDKNIYYKEENKE